MSGRVLRLDKPAEHWLEAFPVGDGRLGALVFGGTTNERLALNADTFWSGVRRDTTDVARKAAFERVTELLRAGQTVEAEAAARAMQGPETESYQPVGDIELTIDDASDCVAYERWLDLTTRTVHTRFALASGLEVDRRVTIADGQLVVRTHTNRECPLEIAFTSPHPVDGNNPWGVHAPVHVVGLMTGLTGLQSDEPIVYRDGAGMTVTVSAAASGDEVRVAIATGDGSSPPGDAAGWLERVTVDLGPAGESIAELFDYGRYLLVSSSMPGTQPATLQGIWNVHRRPPWNSNYTININTEMNYWSANVANLPECNGPLFDLIDGLVTSGTRTAAVDYGAPGWVAHHNTDYWRHTTAVGEGRSPSHWSAWPFGGVWLARHLWEHWLYTGDERFLHERAFPVMRGAAEFVKALLVELPDGTLLTPASTSPENDYGDASIALGPTCDRVLARELFTNLGDHETAARIPGEAIGRHGQIMEWFEDLDDPADDHRHTSHLVGLFPGRSIDAERTPDLATAAARTLDMRGPGAQGWAILWRACLWARLRDGDRAWELLQRLDAPCPVEPPFGPVGGRYPNGFLAHPPFQIDANLGLPAAVIELFMQSHNGYVHLLPAVPAAVPDGELRGIVARGGHVVDMRWRDGVLVDLDIAPGFAPLRVRVQDGPVTDH